MSNMKQVGYGLSFYSTEYSDYVPREGKPHVAFANRYYYPWPRSIRKYLVTNLPITYDTDPNNAGRSFTAEEYANLNDNAATWGQYHYSDVDAYKCPSHPNRNHQIHYINNGLLTKRNGFIDVNTRHPTCLITEFMRPADAMLMGEFTDDVDNSIHNQQQSYSHDDHWYDVWAEIHVTGPETGSNGIGSNVARISSSRHHGTGSNTIFADTHVEFRQRDTLKDIENWDDRTYNDAWY